MFFGGNKKKVKVVNVSSKEIIPEHIDTAIGQIHSLRVCQTGKKVYLAIAGKNSDFSDNTSDLIDLKGFLENISISYKFFPESYLDQAKKTIKSQAKIISRLTENCERLENRLKKLSNKEIEIKRKELIFKTLNKENK